MSCPQIWNTEREKDREKEKLGRQASEAQREKELERETKNKRRYFLLEEHQDASGYQGENERLRKKTEQEHVRHFLHKTCN